MASRTEMAWRPGRTLAGLEIGDTHVRWCALGRHQGHWQLQQFQSWPLKPGWVEAGRILDYQSVLDALQQWLAGLGVTQLAMALPAEVCVSQVLDAPRRLLPWQRRSWLSGCAGELLGRPASELSWSAHPLPGSPARWRLTVAPIEQVQDWLGLAEAVGCELVALDEVHQAAWRALDQWQDDLPTGSWLFQVAGGSIQALHEQGGHWQWAWREPTDSADWPDRCVAQVGQAPVFWTGRSEQASDLERALLAADLQPQRPVLSQTLQGASGRLAPDDADAIWPALGLASRRLRS